MRDTENERGEKTPGLLDMYSHRVLYSGSLTYKQELKRETEKEIVSEKEMENEREGGDGFGGEYEKTLMQKEIKRGILKQL